MRRLCQREHDFLLYIFKQKIVFEAFSENFFLRFLKKSSPRALKQKLSQSF